jgi:hypothetical protein
MDFVEELMLDDEEPVMSQEHLEHLVEEHLRNDDTQTATFWAEKILALDQGRTLNERLPQIAHYLSVT